ncbi:MAG: hypothetical protein P8164_05095 [Gammaproteobacteria bacterium]|jgi:hypothetical protein
MHELMQNPAVQAGILPFITALVLALVLSRLGWYWAGLALIAGFIATVYVVVGFQFQPWTSTRKIIALGLVAAGLGLLLDIYPWSRRWLPVLLFVLAAVAALWLAWPVLKRRAGMGLWTLGIGSVLFSGWCTAAMESLRAKPAQAGSAAVALGFGSGVVVLLGASALLGELGMALGAAAGALWLLVAATRNARLGSVAMLPAGLLCGLIGIGGHVYAKVPWYSLALLALVPVCVRVPLSSQWPRWILLFVPIVLASFPAAIAVWLVWRVEGGVPL